MRIKSAHYAQKGLSFAAAVILLCIWLALDHSGRNWPLIPILVAAIAISWWLGDRLIWKRRRK